MKIAILGTGRMGKGLVKTFSQAYPQDVLLSSRDSQRAQDVLDELKLDAKAADINEALQADVIIPTFWFRDLIPWAIAHKEKLKGKIVIDITNPFNEDFSDFTTAYDTSSAEELQKVIPESKVVGA